MLLRVEDISEVVRSRTEQLHEQLLAEEGLLPRVPFGYSIDLRSWRSAIDDLSGEHPILILECELLEDPDFVIGHVLKVGKKQVTMKYFTGAANWLEEPVQVKYNEITSCQVATNYANMYQRHFERKAL